MDRHKMSNFYRGPSINASYQVSVHLAKGFQRRRLKCEKLTDDGRPSDGKKWMTIWLKNQQVKHYFFCHNKVQTNKDILKTMISDQYQKRDVY